jgi:hypothetical protein
MRKRKREAAGEARRLRQRVAGGRRRRGRRALGGVGEHRGRETSERREEERKTRMRNLVGNYPRGFLQNDPCVILSVPEGVYIFFETKICDMAINDAD